MTTASVLISAAGFVLLSMWIVSLIRADRREQARHAEAWREYYAAVSDCRDRHPSRERQEP